MASKFSKTLVIIALILLFVVLVAARIPARWGVWALHHATPAVRLMGISGTIWEGRAVGGTLIVGNQRVPVENLRWDVNPWTLLGLKVCAHVEAQVMAQPASGDVCGAPGNTFTATNTQVSAPMALMNQWTGLKLAGQASLQLQTLRMQDQRVEEMQGNLSWRDARWNDGERWIPLGAFAAKLSEGSEGGVAAEMFELDGPFKLQLTGNFVVGKEPVIKGVVTPSEQAPAQISEALQFVGEPVEGGGFRVAWPPGT